MDNRVDPDRIPFAQVVSQLVKVQFDDALKEANAGDTNMQVLVGQIVVGHDASSLAAFILPNRDVVSILFTLSLDYFLFPLCIL
ncbi:hypothetical protein ERO13_D10G252520v2 [Gossypium hirsutum]|nr:hypothetical protein ERO13_D10G252520v2 [Gossypium hirsutum]